MASKAGSGTVPPPSSMEIFETAKKDFIAKLDKPEQYVELSRYTTIDVVYEILKEQSKVSTVRNLGRARPYIDALAQFSGVIEVFTQVKPELLGLIWGPVKLALQLAGSVLKALDKFLDVLAVVGNMLPQFSRYSKLFAENEEIQKVMGFFYADILELHVTILNFFTRKKWKLFFEPFWPKTGGKIALIQSHIRELKDSLDNEIQFEAIFRSHVAREKAYEEYQKEHDFQSQQLFEAMLTRLSPRLYDDAIVNCTRESGNAGQWLMDKPEFVHWLRQDIEGYRTLWLHGIPGAGKTILTASMVRRMQADKQRFFFAFLSYKDSENNTCLKVFHSLIFQILFDEPELRPVILAAYKSSYRQLKSDVSYVFELLGFLLNDPRPVHLVVDGLDEADEHEKKYLLKFILSLQDKYENVRFFLSSRFEKDIARALRSEVTIIRVDENNAQDIEFYVRNESRKLIEQMREFGAGEDICSTVEFQLTKVTKNAKGMFLYARLMMSIILEIDNPYEVEAEINNLPDGLEQAYGRILGRMKRFQRDKEREAARRILHWVGCARVPLREEELLQALAIEVGSPDFTAGQKVFRDICKTCGPILEVREDTIQFVHFTVHEYLFGRQSNFFLDQAEANLQAASVCSTYLSLSALELVISNQIIDQLTEKQILKGFFVFFSYAALELIEHVRACQPLLAPKRNTNVGTTLGGLCGLLFNFFRKYGFSRAVAYDPAANPLDFRNWDVVNPWLCESEEYLLELRVPGQSIFTDFRGRRPKAMLAVLAALVRLRLRIENMLCPQGNHASECFCQQLKRLYGERLFKCSHFACPMFRDGFDTADERNLHLLRHKFLKGERSDFDLGFVAPSSGDDDGDDGHDDRRRRVGSRDRYDPAQHSRPPVEEQVDATPNTSEIIYVYAQTR